MLYLWLLYRYHKILNNIHKKYNADNDTITNNVIKNKLHNEEYKKQWSQEVQCKQWYNNKQCHEQKINYL